MDNFHMDITSEGRTQLQLALDIAFDNAPGGTAVGYRIIPEKGLTLYWTPVDKMLPFMTKLAAKDICPLVERWLEEQDYGEQPDHDGSNGKGWRVYNEAWGHVNNEWEAFIAIEPKWAMYGK